MHYIKSKQLLLVTYFSKVTCSTNSKPLDLVQPNFVVKIIIIITKMVILNSMLKLYFNNTSVYVGQGVGGKREVGVRRYIKIETFDQIV